MGYDKWEGSLAGMNGMLNGSICGIPIGADPIVKFNPVNKSITHIGPDFGDDIRMKWRKVASMTGSTRAIYSVPCNKLCVLKIDTYNDNVT